MVDFPASPWWQEGIPSWLPPRSMLYWLSWIILHGWLNIGSWVAKVFSSIWGLGYWWIVDVTTLVMRWKEHPSVGVNLAQPCSVRTNSYGRSFKKGHTKPAAQEHPKATPTMPVVQALNKGSETSLGTHAVLEVSILVSSTGNDVLK